MKKRIAAGLLFLCLLALSVQGAAFAQALEQEQYEDWIWEPCVEKDDSLSTGQAALWACITFGSYPQTEIVPAAFTAVDDYAVREGDVLEDPDLYEKLAGAEWTDNRTEIGGVRYLRMDRGDAAGAGGVQHYRWEEGGGWHYFRFDPIRWRIIGLEDGAAWLMADRLLDCLPWNTEDGPVSWENSTIRSWLNGYPAEENSAGADYRGKRLPGYGVYRRGAGSHPGNPGGKPAEQAVRHGLREGYRGPGFPAFQRRGLQLGYRRAQRLLCRQRP